MMDEAGAVIYVGKARNLKKRVSNYFTTGIQQSLKTHSMMQQVRDIEVTVTHTENEALILENNLIKELKPLYNVWFRDDKSYPYIYLSSEHAFPRLSYYRGARHGKGQYFGPYPSAGAVKQTLNLIQKLFQIRSCEDSFFANRTRPCLQYQIKRCTAPCVELIDSHNYRADVKHAVMFLEGKNEQVIDSLLEPMQQASDALEYERAAHYRDQISNLRKVQEHQYISAQSGDVDVIACRHERDICCVQVIFIRGGLNLGSKPYFPKFPKDEGEAEIINAFLPQFYLDKHSGRKIPQEILVSQKPKEIDLLQSVLSEQAGKQVNIKYHLRGDRAKWLKMALENADIALHQRLASRESQQYRLQDLQKVLSIDDALQRIECFDVSHTHGEATVASCVVFGKDGPIKSDYRKFNITDIEHGDDYAAIRQVVQRRYTRIKKEDGKLPDLILIDGGKGQVSMAKAVLEELQLTEIALIGIAKGPTRKPGMENLIIAQENKTMRLSPDSSALHLIQEIRDEAHRFAITGHRQRRKNIRKRSMLENIEGVGSKRRYNLIRHFGGIQGIARAGVDDLAMVRGINKSLAQKIYSTFHENG